MLSTPRLIRIFFAALPLIAALSPSAYGQLEATEDAVKAAFLHRFTGFIEWPAQVRAKDSIVIGVMNADGVESELSRYVAARKSSIAVRHIETIDDLPGVHVLFIGARENARLSKIIAALRDLPVLVVTEAPDALERGAMINFVTTDRIQFEVAVANAAKAGLHLNARLLSVAIRVRKGERDIFWEGQGMLARRAPPARAVLTRRAIRATT